MSFGIHDETAPNLGTSASVTPLRAEHAPSGGPARFRLGRLIGRGATSAVYEAQDDVLHRTVAVKLLLPQHRDALAEVFLHEARVAAAVTHPHVLPLHACEDIDGQRALVMPFIADGSLADAAEQIGRVDPPVLATILDAVAGALDALATEHLVHADVKPANILLARSTSGFHAYLADFGAGLHTFDAANPLNARGRPLGTLGFAAPEQLACGPIGPRTDVYGLAATAFWCLTGEHTAAASANTVSLRAHRPDLDPGLDAVLGRALAADPDERYPSAGAFAAAMRDPLRRGSRPTQIGPQLRETLGEPVRRRRFRGPRPRAGFALIALCFLAPLGLFGARTITRDSHAPSPTPRTDATTAPDTIDASTASRGEAELLATVPTQLRATCTRSAVTGSLAALRCTDPKSGIIVRYTRFADRPGMDAFFDSLTDASERTGTCADGRPGRRNWRASRTDPVPAGRVQCSDDGPPTMIWTTDALLTVAAADGPADLAAFWQWWQRVPGPVSA